MKDRLYKSGLHVVFSDGIVKSQSTNKRFKVEKEKKSFVLSLTTTKQQQYRYLYYGQVI